MFVNDLLSRLDTVSNGNQKQLIASLEEMKGNLETIKSSMDTLRLAKNKKEALVMASVVKATAKNGKATVQSIKENDGSAIDGKVLASLNETEKQFQDMENMVVDVQKEFIVSLITDLKTRSLTARNQDLLKKAEEDYKNGKIEEAAMEISWISQ
jgi:phage terminase Nu1 subunit (DNA packaging protein)